MAKKFVSEGTLKKVMNLMLSLFPSQELTETEVKQMYEDAEVKG